jgi:hypothetical protein
MLDLSNLVLELTSFTFRNTSKCGIKPKAIGGKTVLLLQNKHDWKDLDIRFLEAVEIASEMTKASLPQDVNWGFMPITSKLLGTLDLKQTSSYHLRDV